MSFITYLHYCTVDNVLASTLYQRAQDFIITLVMISDTMSCKYDDYDDGWLNAASGRHGLSSFASGDWFEDQLTERLTERG